MTEEELWEAARTVQAYAPLTELKLRSEAATRKAIEELGTAIGSFNASSQKYSRVLVALTVVIAILTLVMVVQPLLRHL